MPGWCCANVFPQDLNPISVAWEVKITTWMIIFEKQVYCVSLLHSVAICVPIWNEASVKDSQSKQDLRYLPLMI